MVQIRGLGAVHNSHLVAIPPSRARTSRQPERHVTAYPAESKVQLIAGSISKLGGPVTRTSASSMPRSPSAKFPEDAV